MKLFNYLEAKYTECTYSVKKDFDLAIQAESQAAHGLINLFRMFYRWRAYPKLLVGFLLVRVGIKNPPKPAEDQIKVLMDAAKKAKEKDLFMEAV